MDPTSDNIPEDQKEKELTPEEIEERIRQIQKIMEDPRVDGMHRMNLIEEMKRLQRKMLGFKDPLGLNGKIATAGLDGLSETEFQTLLENTGWDCAGFVKQLGLGQHTATPGWEADLRCTEWAHGEATKQNEQIQNEQTNNCRWVLVLYNPSDLLMHRLSMLARGGASSTAGGWENKPHNIWVIVIGCSQYPDQCGLPMIVNFIGCPPHIYED
ncbi:hypothetical protein HZC00_05350 [Candidatus Kaiserbacteria bacterium]|nr:hypothetical protein [Candidatus Kaiserbacteria bacterium]